MAKTSDLHLNAVLISVIFFDKSESMVVLRYEEIIGGMGGKLLAFGLWLLASSVIGG
jgi:hypothetical protein